MVSSSRCHQAKRSTLLIVGEGAHEKAFLDHMKMLYDTRTNGQKLKIDAADGGSPLSMLKWAKRRYQHADYDNKYLLLDSDIAICPQTNRLARQCKVLLLYSTPICLEGMLLTLIGRTPPDQAEKCKQLLHPLLSGSPMEKDSYTQLFHRQLLDAANHQTIVTLRCLISNSAS